MEKFCAIRDVCRAISEFENHFIAAHNLSLNEGMLLCSLKDTTLSSGEIAKMLTLTCSNTSKLIRSVEDKGYIERVLGETDRRQMYFKLSITGKEKLIAIKNDELVLPYPLSKLMD